MKKLSVLLFLPVVYLSTFTIKAQTFNNDIAPIIFAKCATCHNPNGINSSIPFTNYQEVIDDTSGVKTDINSGHMPPWPPDTTYTKFLHQRVLTATEKNKILQWISNGAPEGTGNAPICPTFVISNQLSGVADLVVGTGIIKSNSASGNTNPYNCFVIPLGLTEDKWLRAVEIVPGSNAVVHHAVVTIDTMASATSDMSGNCTNQPGQFSIGGWSSGAAPVVYPNKAPLKAGQRIPKGSSIVIQMHYAPGSGGLIDSTKVRLYFYNKDSLTGIRPVYDAAILQNWQGTIPANSVTTFTANPVYNINFNLSLLAANPHSHFVCTNIINYAFNGTDTIPLIRVNDWHYHWQGYYYYPKPVKVLTSHKLQSKHIFDNTINNSELITDANNSVSFGKKTTDEMLFDGFVFMVYNTGDENIDLAALASADTIYSNGLKPKPYEKAVSVSTSLTFTPVTPTISAVGLALTSSSAPSYQWYMNDTAIQGATSQNYTASQNGNYSVIIYDSGIASAPSNTIVISIPTTPVITQNGTVLTSTAVSGNQWYLNGSQINSASGQTYTVSQSGNYSDVVTISGISSASSNTITISMPLTPTITQNVTVLSSNSSTGNQWYLNGNIIPNATATTYTITQDGNYTDIVTTTSISSAPSNTIIISIPSTPTITQNGSVLTSNLTTGNQWYLNGNSIPNATATTYTITQDGNYTNIVTTTGISSASSNTITITIPTTPTITQNGTLLTSSVTTGNQWYLNGTVINGANIQTYTVSQSGDYYNIVTSTGISSVPSNTITISMPSTPTITQNATVLSSSSSSGNQWYLNGNIIPNATATTYTITQDGNYTNIVTTTGISSASSNTITITNPATPTITQNGTVLSSSSVNGNQWYLNGTVISGATAQNYSPAQNGNFYTVVTNTGISSPASNIITITSFLTTTGISQISSIKSCIVYPNPSKGVFIIQSITKILAIEVTNDGGAIVLEQLVNADKATIDLSKEQNGVYFLKIISQQGNTTEKLIVNR